MKKMTLVTLIAVVLVAALFTGCKYIKGQILDGPGMEREVDKEAVRAFVEQFYQGWDGEDILNYDYPKQHVTPHLLKYLADAYDFDCEGECLSAR